MNLAFGSDLVEGLNNVNLGGLDKIPITYRAMGHGCFVEIY